MKEWGDLVRAIEEGMGYDMIEGNGIEMEDYVRE